MKKYIFLFTGLVILASGCSSSNEILNLDTAKKLVQNYYESGKYNSECAAVFNEAKNKIADLPPDSNSTVVFDVDDTALSNYEYSKSIGFGYYHSLWYEWIESGKFKAVPEVKNFYDWLIAKKIKIIFLTGRHSETFTATKRNLIDQGYARFDTLIVRNNVEKNLPAAEFKSIKREELTARGFKIIACVGDQLSDLTGKFAGIKIKLPNYLYIIE